MMDTDDYYDILELSRGASEADVKKAYRQMALRWHPDKNQTNQAEAERRFKRISEAYEVLSDPEKRRIYDQYGKAGLEQSQAAGDQDDFYGGGRQRYPGHQRHHGADSFSSSSYYHFRDPRDVFRDFFGPGDPFTRIFYSPSSFRTFEESAERQRASNLGQGFTAPNFHSMFNNYMSAGFASDPAASRRSQIPAPRGQRPPLHSTRIIQTVTKVVNGRRIIVRKLVENGVETVTEYDADGVIISQTVNGHSVTLDNEYMAKLSAN